MSDQVQLDNELICEKLLGWRRDPASRYVQIWRINGGFRETPSFTTGAEAWLILNALPQWELEKHGDCFEFAIGDQIIRFADIAEEAIRAAALAYLKEMKP